MIKRRNGETELDFHKRLLKEKMDDRTLDASYSDLSVFLYGKKYSEDVARRMAYGSRKTMKLADKFSKSQFDNNTDILDEIERRTAELKKEQKKFQDQRREYNKLLTQESREEHISSELLKSAKSLNVSIGQLDFGLNNYDTTNNEAVLVLTDWHYGMVAKNIYNQYDKEICKRRVQDVIRAASERIVLHKVSKLHVVVLGDLFHGAIHNSARVASEELVVDQLMQSSEILAQSIATLGKIVPEIDVYTTYGNHARTVQNKHDSIHRDNMERIIPWWLEQRLADFDNIKIVNNRDDEFILVNIGSYNILASHGDNDSVRNSKTLTTLFYKKYGIDIDYILLGDKHHRESFDELGVTSIICGSLSGTDDYANNKRLFSEPSQLLLIANPKIGIDAEYTLKVV